MTRGRLVHRLGDWYRRRRDGDGGDRGAIIPIVVLSLGFMMTATAFTVDLGRVMVRNRDMQSIADVVALDLVRKVDGRTVDELNADPDFAGQITLSRERNAFPATEENSLDYELGWVTLANHEFVPATRGTDVPNAVKVTATDLVHYFFVPGANNAGRTAVALGNAPPPPPPRDPDPDPDPCEPLDPYVHPECFEWGAEMDYVLGSFFASATPTNTQVQILNRVLQHALGGGAVSLDAASYAGLADGQVTVRQLSTQMGFGSPDDFLTSTVNVRQFLLASATVVSNNGGPTAAVTALQTLAATVSSSATLEVGDIIAVYQGAHDPAVDTYFDAFNLATGTAFVMNGENTVSIPSVTFTTPSGGPIPGIGSVTVTVKVIETPRIILGAKVGEVAETSQVDIGLTVPVNLTNVGGGLLSANVTGTQTYNLSIADATAEPTYIACPGNSAGYAPSADLWVTSAPTTTTGSENLTLSAQVLFSRLDLLSTTITNASVSTTNDGGTATFDYPTDFLPPVGSGDYQRLGNTTMNLNGAMASTSANSTVLSLPLGFTDLQLMSIVNTALNTNVHPQIQNQILPTIAHALGLQYGGADVGALDMRCTGPVLAG